MKSIRTTQDRRDTAALHTQAAERLETAARLHRSAAEQSRSRDSTGSDLSASRAESAFMDATATVRQLVARRWGRLQLKA